MPMPSETTKVSKTKQRETRKAGREEKAVADRLLIQQRQTAAAKRIFGAIAEEAATKAIIVYARIESAKEVERIRQEKAEIAERKRIQRIEDRVQRKKDAAEKLEKDKERYFAKLDEYLQVLPKDFKEEHEGYCSCDKCKYTPNRDYIIATEKTENTVYIFLLPESFDSYRPRDIDLVTFAIQRKYNIFNLKYYIKGVKELKTYIHYQDKYRIVGLDEKRGKVKPFDTYSNPDFWSEINRSFIDPLKELISKYYGYHDQEFIFKNEFYSTFSTNKDTDDCSHQTQKAYEYSCPFDNNCPMAPQKRSIFEPLFDTFGTAFIPFQTTTYCCANKNNCVLRFKISYENCKIGITIGSNRRNSCFYSLNDLNKINFGEIEGGLFKSESMCKSCKLELKKQNAIEEVSTIFGMNTDTDEFTCTIVSNFINSYLHVLVGETIYPIRHITGDCSNWCINSRQDKYNYYDSGECYDQCKKCSDVKKIYNSGDGFKVNCQAFSIYKLPEQSIQEKKSKQFAPNYLFEFNSFSQKDIEMIYLYSICLSFLPLEIIDYISQFLRINRSSTFNVSKKKMIQLDSLEDDSPNLTLAKMSLKEQKYLMKLNESNESVKKFYKL